MEAEKIVLDSVTGEEITDWRECACCGAIHDRTGPIGYERGELDGYCGHWTCDVCQESASESRWGRIKRCAACEEGL